ncbi:hypothetical protein D3C85_1763840 [compost metagenome]
MNFCRLPAARTKAGAAISDDTAVAAVAWRKERRRMGKLSGKWVWEHAASNFRAARHGVAGR